MMASVVLLCIGIVVTGLSLYGCIQWWAIAVLPFLKGAGVIICLLLGIVILILGISEIAGKPQKTPVPPALEKK
jgi:hypothetical protein